MKLVNECPLGGEVNNECEFCVYRNEFEYMNGGCIRKGCEAYDNAEELGLLE